MNIELFKQRFEEAFPETTRDTPTYAHWDPIVTMGLDPCPDVPGMLSIKKQQLLNLVFGLLDPEEAYFEVGTYMGKSLLSAMLNNPPRTVFACDDFSLFEGNTFETTLGHLKRYGVADKVHFYNGDFLGVYTAEHLSKPIGFYFYDGAHDEESQYLGIKLVEPFLADEAIVLVDDWRFERDSQSYARAGTLRALEESEHQWQLLYELPARFNGDKAMWWNGVAVLGFSRKP